VNDHLTEEQLLWHHYGEGADGPGAEAHLASCPGCRQALASLAATLNAITAWPVPERGLSYGERVWRGLAARHTSVGRSPRWWSRWLSPWRLTLVGGLAASLGLAFWMGRVTSRPEAIEASTPPDIVRERILAAALTEHLEASQRILLELANRESAGDIDVRDEQQRAEELLEGNRLYRLAATRQGQRALASVLDDLERVLLDVARGPTQLSPRDRDGLRARMEEQGLVFKVRVLEQRLRELQDRPLPRPDRVTDDELTKG
jgi:hypothetical protein